MHHTLEPTPDTLHGHFSRDLAPILTIQPGDTINLKTLDAGWGVFDNPDPFAAPERFEPRDRERDPGHAMIGPIAVDGATPGMTLAIEFNAIEPGTWGWNSAGWNDEWNAAFGVEGDEYFMRWKLEGAFGTNQLGHRVRLAPFMGNVSLAPTEPGIHSTRPPRYCGGNMDCKELVVGTTLYLPVGVPRGLLFIGDGHAAQGDGEVSGTAIECPMKRVKVKITLQPEMQITMPRAYTPTGWVTFGFDEDLDQAHTQALDQMLTLLGERYGLGRKKAWALASVAVDMRVTQVVNQVKGVHALLPHGAIAK